MQSVGVTASYRAICVPVITSAALREELLGVWPVSDGEMVNDFGMGNAMRYKLITEKFKSVITFFQTQNGCCK